MTAPSTTVNLHHLTATDIGVEHSDGHAYARLGPVTVHGTGDTVDDRIDHLIDLGRALMAAGYAAKQRHADEARRATHVDQVVRVMRERAHAPLVPGGFATFTTVLDHPHGICGIGDDTTGRAA